MDKLEKIRQKINRIDSEMLELYKERMALMKDVAEYKKENDIPIYNQSREIDIIKQNLSLLNTPQLNEFYQEFIQLLMDQGKVLQEIYLKGPQ